MKKGYAYIENPESVEVNFVMKPTLYSANAEVDACAGKVALMYGPVVYCAEGIDNNINLHRIYIDENINPRFEPLKELDTDCIIIDAYKKNTSSALYAPANNSFEKTELKLIPYRLFANRGESDMLVWFNQK